MTNMIKRESVCVREREREREREKERERISEQAGDENWSQFLNMANQVFLIRVYLRVRIRNALCQ